MSLNDWAATGDGDQPCGLTCTITTPPLRTEAAALPGRERGGDDVGNDALPRPPFLPLPALLLGLPSLSCSSPWLYSEPSSSSLPPTLASSNPSVPAATFGLRDPERSGRAPPLPTLASAAPS